MSWAWSECSRNDIIEALEMNRLGSCLSNKPSSLFKYKNGSLCGNYMINEGNLFRASLELSMSLVGKYGNLCYHILLCWVLLIN